MLPVTKVSLLAAKSIACHTPFVTDFLVPIADDDFLEMPARYRLLNSSTDGHRIDGGVPQSGLSIDHDRTVLLTLGPENRNSVVQRNRSIVAKPGIGSVSRNRPLVTRVQSLHFSDTENRQQSSEGEDQFSLVSVGSAA